MRNFTRMTGSVMPGSGAFPQMPQTQQVSENSAVLGYLGRALSMEMSAGQHYLAQSALAKYRQEFNFAETFVTLANEEFQHANMLIDRIIAHGALPASSILKPAQAANNTIEALRVCEEREIELINLYQEACQVSKKYNAIDDAGLFEKLLKEENKQLIQIQSWITDYYQRLLNANTNKNLP